MTKPISDFTNLEYLRRGTLKQKKAYKLIKELKMFDVLQAFNPILAGTIPIEVDLPDSDLDIICEVYDFNNFIDLIYEEYGEHKDFNCKIRVVDGITRVVCNFNFKGWRFEIFGQSIPTIQQNAYRHMIIEHRILSVLGNKAKKYIIDLKKKGIKTEPSFGKLLKIKSDPYKFLIEMNDWDEKRLSEYLKAKSFDINNLLERYCNDGQKTNI